jgi:hypothetical protein
VITVSAAKATWPLVALVGGVVVLFAVVSAQGLWPTNYLGVSAAPLRPTSVSATAATAGATGASTKLADITLGADATTIDTGIEGIASGYDMLTVWIVAKTDDASGGDGTHGGTLIPIYVTVNGDRDANYDLSYIVEGGYGTFGHGVLRGQHSWEMTAHGSGGTGGYPAVDRLTIPNYARTTFAKVAEETTASPDGMADNDNETVIKSLGWRGTAAISRMTITTGGANKLKAGSRLLIYGQGSGF